MLWYNKYTADVGEGVVAEFYALFVVSVQEGADVLALGMVAERSYPKDFVVPQAGTAAYAAVRVTGQADFFLTYQ